MTHGKSVVVPVDAEVVLDAAAAYLRKQYGASYGLDHPTDRQRILSSIPAAPAPSSLAGGEWNREDHGNSTLLYTLKERGWRKGEPIMVNDKTVRIEFDGDREPVIAAILAALSPEAPAREGGEIGEEFDNAAHCVTLAECPPGLFLWNGSLGFKSEYGAMEPVGISPHHQQWKVGNRADAYCADSGEYFWGGTSTHEDRAKVLVYPIDARTVAMVASHGPAALTPRHEAPASEDEARRKLIQCIEQWDGETEYDADDLASLADNILHAFNGPPVVSRAAPVELSSNPCQLEAPACTTCGGKGYTEHEGGDGEGYPSRPEIDDCPRCHEAPADGAGEREALAAIMHRNMIPDEDGGFSFHDLKAADQIMDYLRARSSAPEAREGEPVGVVYSLKADLNTAELPDGTLLYTHPAAPSADKLRGIVQRCVNALDASRNGGEFPSFEEWEADARQALAALKAEGA